MSGNGARKDRPFRPSDPLTGPGLYIAFFGAVMFILPTFLHRSLVITSWLGSMEPPVGLALIVVGVAIAITGVARGRMRPPVLPPAIDPNIVPPPPGPVVGGIGTPTSPATPPGPGTTFSSTPAAAPTAPASAPSSPGAGIDAPPPALEPLYRAPTSMDDLRPPDPPSA
jgi:hypothetical protein